MGQPNEGDYLPDPNYIAGLQGPNYGKLRPVELGDDDHIPAPVTTASLQEEGGYDDGDNADDDIKKVTTAALDEEGGTTTLPPPENRRVVSTAALNEDGAGSTIKSNRTRHPFDGEGATTVPAKKRP